MAGFSLRLDSDLFAAAMTARTGLELCTAPSTENVVVSVRAADISSPNGFSVRIRTSWRSIEASFEPDNFAGALIRQMSSASIEDRRRLSKVLSALVASGLRVSLHINGSTISDFENVPSAPWTSLGIKVARLADPGLGEAKLLEFAKEVCGGCLAPVLVLLAKEDDSSLHHEETGLPEGAKTRVEVNRYERSAANRAACIAIHGARCSVCGFDFEKFYGQLGSGFIEVHHRVMVSRLGSNYVVDPKSDLVPLCSNCHSMIHRVDPPMDAEELRSLIRSPNH